ncbi:MAG TPA: Clp protease N-terminal domain-containing protein [Thermomicrobiaceae bacterium]|nr:Clp protease N-terminal domain-containing protein [Thermomicrobiaceae bacterium]
MADKSEKFTERARKVLTLAQDEAHRFNHHYIGTEHLLLGLAREGDGVAARVLANMGVDAAKVRGAVEFIIGRGDAMIVGEIGLTPRAKKVIELAVDEARGLNHHYIGTEHLLLGLVREGEGIAAGVLESLGVRLPQVRQQVLQAISPGVLPPPQAAPERPRRPPRPRMPALGELRRVLALNQTQRELDAAATILSLEDYQQGAIIHALIRPGHPLGPPDQPPPIPRHLKAQDELDTRYSCSPQHSFFDADSFHFSLRLSPALNPGAHSLRLEFDTLGVPDATLTRWVFELPL